MKLKIFGLVVLTLAVIGIGWQQFQSTDAVSKPIRYVRIEGAFQYTDKEKLKELLTPEMMRGFYHANVDTITHLIADMPLVEKVDVDRIWPDSVHIRIQEQKPIVRWGEKAVLNKWGDVLVPESIDEFKNLPLITGPEGQARKLLEIMKGVYIVLMDKSLHLAEFHVNERRAWHIKLANGIEMELGRKAPLENLQRFLKTMDLLGDEQIAKIAAIDMRYPNGYAVTWKPDASATDWKAVAEKYKNLI